MGSTSFSLSKTGWSFFTEIHYSRQGPSVSLKISALIKDEKE